jgi:5'-phosphate synthase pdxT subunit
MVRRLKIGILALQGDFYKHAEAVKKTGHEAILVKNAESLAQCDKLIIPGGESTTLLHLIKKLDLRQPLLEFGRTKAVMGTCAGLILLGKGGEKLPDEPLQLIDIQVKRNAYGRQIDSFIDAVEIQLNGHTSTFEGVFIRAPKIKAVGTGVTVLGRRGQEVIMAVKDNILVMTFHPELTDDTRIHRFFIENIH